MPRLPFLIALFCLLAPAALAQPKPRESNRYMTYKNEKAWVVSSRYFIYPDGRRVREVRPGTVAFQGGPYERLEFVAPIVFSSANAWNDPENKDFPFWEVRFSPGNTAGFASRATRVPGTDAWYLLLQADAPIVTEQLQIRVDNLLYCAETEFDERAAWDLPWPAQWPAETRSWLERDPTFDLPASDGSDAVQALLDNWTGGNDPRQVPPVQLAKFLTGHVLDHVRSNSTNSETPIGRPAAVLRDGRGTRTVTLPDEVLSFTGMIGGFRVQNAAEVARNRVGSEHDLANLLAAVLRRAGIPTRLVIGVDKENSSLHRRVKSWVEFAVVAPDVSGVIWVPVDVRELKGSGRSSRNWQQNWKNFGTCDLLRNVVPVAHHFHPPANFHTYAFPALFGIRFDRSLEEPGTQGALFEVNSLPSGGPVRRP